MFETIQYDLTRISYGRRGTFYYVGAWEEDGAEMLYVCALLSGLDNAGPAGKPRAGRLFPVRLVRNGETAVFDIIFVNRNGNARVRDACL